MLALSLFPSLIAVGRHGRLRRQADERAATDEAATPGEPGEPGDAPA